MTRIIGIDPGTTGAIAVIFGDGTPDVLDLPSAVTGKMRQIDPYELLKIVTGLEPDYAFIEQVGANTMSYKGNFALGHAFGCCLTALAASGAKVHRIRPKEWQAVAGLANIPAKERKDAHRLRAMEQFPELRPKLKLKSSHNRADAILIAEAGRRTL